MTSTCQWPLWGDRQRAPVPPTFCGQPLAPADGRPGPYCPAHADRARFSAEDREASRPATRHRSRFNLWSAA